MRQATVKNPGEAKAIIKAEIRRTDEARLQHRLHCGLLICEGKTCAQVVALFGDSLRAVESWVKRLDQAGMNSLRDTTRPGRRPRLWLVGMEILAQGLHCSPREFGYAQNLWDGKLLSPHLKERSDIELRIRQCQNLFHQSGFRRRKPRPVIAKTGPEAQETYRTTQRSSCGRRNGCGSWITAISSSLAPVCLAGSHQKKKTPLSSTLPHGGSLKRCGND